MNFQNYFQETSAHIHQAGCKYLYEDYAMNFAQTFFQNYFKHASKKRQNELINHNSKLPCSEQK